LSSPSQTPRASDADLVRKVASGDVDAIGALYDRHVGILLPLAIKILGQQPEAEDVLHDAFVALSERAGQYVEDRGTVMAWLVTLVRNLSIDRARRRRRRAAIDREVLRHEPVVSEGTPEKLASSAREHERVRRALAGLPEEQRHTLEIAFFEGLTYPEIAEREKVPLGTVKSRAARALMALRAALGGE
jgi:RNA polymerase sigma-70 factor (ECF subfamily)